MCVCVCVCVCVYTCVSAMLCSCVDCSSVCCVCVYLCVCACANACMRDSMCICVYGFGYAGAEKVYVGRCEHTFYGWIHCSYLFCSDLLLTICSVLFLYLLW